MSEVTRILSAIEQGDPGAASQLLPLVYDELRNWRHRKWLMSNPGRRWKPRPWSTRRTSGWSVMTRRSPGTDEAISSPPRPKRCGGFWSTGPAIATGRSVAEAAAASGSTSISLLARSARRRPAGLDEALQALAREDPAGAELVRLRAFAGLTLAEAAEVMGIGRRTADRYWAYARAWLCDALGDHESTAQT